MTNSMALRRPDYPIDEKDSLKKDTGENSENVELGGVWNDVSTGDEDIEEAKTSLWRGCMIE
ncbi:MAG: hypothetical protein ABEK16_00255 [Candidatus Nanohalobium sp.]